MRSGIKLKNHYVARKERHPFHIVDRSPWPFFVSVALLNLVLSFTHYLHGMTAYSSNLYLSFFCLCSFLVGWFGDIVVEATYAGKHTRRVVRGFKYGMGLFIISEVMFFFSFFVAFFYYALSPSIWVGGV